MDNGFLKKQLELLTGTIDTMEEIYGGIAKMIGEATEREILNWSGDGEVDFRPPLLELSTKLAATSQAAFDAAAKLSEREKAYRERIRARCLVDPPNE